MAVGHAERDIRQALAWPSGCEVRDLEGICLVSSTLQ